MDGCLRRRYIPCGDATSESLHGPPHRGLGSVGAGGAGPHRVGEVAPEIAVLPIDAPDGQPNAGGHGLAGPLRGLTGTARPAVEPERGGELSGDEVPLGAGLAGPSEVVAPLGVSHLVLELGEATPVLGPRFRVEQLPQVARAA